MPLHDRTFVNVFLMFVTLITLFMGCNTSSTSPKRTRKVQSQSNVSHARLAFQEKDYQRAYDICRDLLSNSGDTIDSESVEILMLAGEGATKLQQFELAVSHYQMIPDRYTKQAATARWATGEIYFHLGRPSDSIAALTESVRLNPGLLDAHERLIWMLSVCGRRRETLPHLMAMIQADRVSIEVLLDLGNPWSEYENWQELQRFQRSTPGDLLPNLVQARQQMREGKHQAAEALLLPLIKQQPELIAAHVDLGQIWMVTAPDKLDQWNSGLPMGSQQWSDIWWVRGEWLEKAGNASGAIRCHAEAIRLDPNHPRSLAHLARLLARDGEAFEVFEKRSRLVQQFTQTIDRVWRTQNYEPTIQQSAELAMQLQRYWEAVGWSRYGMRFNTNSTWHKDLLVSLQKSATFNPSMPHTSVEFNLVSDVAWNKKYPVPVMKSSSIDASDQSTPLPPLAETQDTKAIRFVDVAARSGLNFQYKNYQSDRSLGRKMFEITGGGIGVIDFDLDGFCDVFCAQGTPGPDASVESQGGDVLFRNLGPISSLDATPKFEDVTLACGIREQRFGQGVCIADLDSDGFDDVYVANVGKNQLWLNQGDGTFRDGNSLFPKDSIDQWTVSALAADLDGNGLAEILDINYVLGNSFESLRCQVAGKPRACPPLVFSPAPMAMWLPTGLGQFDGYQWNLKSQINCYGLGVLAYRSKESILPKIFVAVDQQANVLIDIQRDSQHPNGFTLEDLGLLSGIAFDHAGKAQACMGVAAGDVDKNGEVDIFVTNFFDESNTMYMQKDGMFADETLKTGLVAPSKSMLGFGTQMLDAQLDGELDLVVMNGHIDDLTHTGVPEKMRPQIFRNVGKSRFVEESPNQAGEYFGIPGLGRALAIADFDRDGLIDLLSSDLDAPHAVLINRSERAGNFVTVFLVGTQSDRNAFFTEVQLEADDSYSQTRQLTAGSGYLSSNQRCIHFAVPNAVHEVKMTIRWPSGHLDSFDKVQPGHVFTAIEGSSLHHR